MSDLLALCRTAWGFTGLVPSAIVDANAFGNLLVEDMSGCYWRICPEELSCTLLARSQDGFDRLRSSHEFRADWRMEHLVSTATALFGHLEPGRCFCLKLPGTLGGTYDTSNLGTIALAELIAFSGALALQIRDVPDGASVRMKIVD